MTGILLALIVVGYLLGVLCAVALTRAARRADIDAAMRRHPAGNQRKGVDDV